MESLIQLVSSVELKNYFLHGRKKYCTCENNINKEAIHKSNLRNTTLHTILIN